MTTDIRDCPVAVIGAGPVGLAAAAHLIERGLPVRVYEAGSDRRRERARLGPCAAVLAVAIQHRPAARALLERHGWQEPPADALPTGARSVRRLSRAACRNAGDGGRRSRPAPRSQAITRQGIDKVREHGRGTRAVRRSSVANGGGALRRDLARAVIDASGTWTMPNPLGAGGLPAEGEAEHAGRIAYGMPDVLGRDRARL